MNEFNTKPTVQGTIADLKDTASTLKDSMSTLVDQGGATIDAIKARATDVKHTVQDGGAAAIDNTKSFVMANPFKGVAIAFGIGYFVMRLPGPILKLGLISGLGYLGMRVARS